MTHLYKAAKRSTIHSNRVRGAIRLAAAEPLESRRLMAVGGFTSSLSGTTATLSGSSFGAEVLTFDASGGLLRHNRRSAGDLQFNSDFDFDTSVAGDQTLSSTDPLVVILVNAGSLDNTITVGSATAPASTLAAAFTVDGQGGSDAVVVNDTTGNSSYTATINVASALVAGISGTVHYSNTEHLTIDAGNGDDVLNVVGTAPLPVDVSAGGGDDIVAFADNSTLGGGVADGGSGTNQINYQSYFSPVTVNLASGSPLHPATGTGGIQSFRNITGGVKDDNLTGDNNPNVIDGFKGNDILVGGPGADQLLGGDDNDVIQWDNGDGSDVIDGGAGSDLVRVNGHPSAGDHFRLQTGAGGHLQFDRTNLGPFTLDISGSEDLEINADAGDDSLTVDFAGGNPIPVSGLAFDGAQGSNQLTLLRSGGAFVATSEEYDPINADTGIFIVEGRVLHFLDMQTLDDTFPANAFAFNALPGTAQIDLTDGPIVSGLQTTRVGSPTDEFRPINLAGKTVINVHGSTNSAGVLTVNIPHPAAGMTTLNLTGGGAADSFRVAPASVPINVDGSPLTTEPGDSLFVDLTGVTESALVPTGPTEGTYAFGNREPITFAGIETVTHTPFLSIDDVTHAEGDAGQTIVVFTVSRTGDTSGTTTVDYSLAPDTATAGDDYQPAIGTVTFDPGQTTRTISVLLNGDTNPESDETYFVNLSSPTNGIITDGQGLGTIQNDDAPAVGLAVSDPSVAEGNAGKKNLTFTVTLGQASGQTVTVKYKTTAGTAKGGSDFDAVSGTLTFAPGQLVKTVKVPVRGDKLAEPDETVKLVLSSAKNSTIDHASGTGTILNDDAPTITVKKASVAEGNAGTTPLAFTVKLSQPTTSTVTVKFKTRDNTAKLSDHDYAAQSGKLTFAPGQTSQTLSILISGDTKHEAKETLFLLLSNPTNALFAGTPILGTIANDD